MRRISQYKAPLLALLCCATQLRAHRVDECLQCAFVAVAPDRITVDLTLAPGIETAPALIAQIDTNRDGVISADESVRFARLVASQLSLELDGRSVELQLVRHDVPSLADLRRGLALISLDFKTTKIAFNSGPHRIRFRNSYHSESSVYLATPLAPTDETVRLGRPERDAAQQTLALSFVISPSPSIARLHAAAP